MPFSTKDYTGAGFEYVVDKEFRPALCFGTKLPRAVMPTKGPGLTGFMRRAGAEARPYSRGLATSVPPPQRPVKMLTIPKSLRWVDAKGYQPPPRVLSPRPPSKRGLYVPFNSSTKQSPKLIDKKIPGPGTYSPSNKKRQMKFNHSFGGMRIVVPAVDVKCVPYNQDVCAICSTGCSEQGDYWHHYNKVFLCRACFERQYVTRSRYNILQLEEFQPIRDCFFAHHHENTENSIKLIGFRELRKRLFKEAYLAQYISNVRVQKYT